ncbi:MAG TPA: hypothetical protein VGM41_03940 [Chitinophagaceae bacterium]|jgi:hypothetical protein
MIYQYVVTLKNSSARFIDRFSLLLLVISITLFVNEQFTNPQLVRIPYLFGVIAVVIALIAIRIYYLRRGDKTRPVYYSSALFIAAIGWVNMPYLPWLVIPFAVMGFFERMAKKPLEIGFSDNSIVINSLFRRRYRWTDFNNIVLKDDLLTLDFKNNRLLQRETLDEEGDAGEDEFNEYCAEQLEKANA